MTILFQQILITVILVLGLKIVLSDGMLLGKLGKIFEEEVDEGNKWADLFYCSWCMSTLQSVVAYFISFGMGWLPFEWNWRYLLMWPLVIMGGSIIAGNIWNIYLTINQIKNKNENESRYFESFFNRGDESEGSSNKSESL